MFIHEIVCEKMFTVGETRPISDANEREQQTQQRWIEQAAGNSCPRRFPTETPLKREGRREQRRRRRKQTTEQREHRLAQRRQNRQRETLR